jgi:hypothetical protein
MPEFGVDCRHVVLMRLPKCDRFIPYVLLKRVLIVAVLNREMLDYAGLANCIAEI